MTQDIKLRIIFCIATFLLLCNFLILSAQTSVINYGFPPKAKEISTAGILFIQRLELPSSAKEEKKIYKEYSPVIIPEYFVLGVLREQFMGLHADRRIDYFDDSEMPLVNFLKNYIQQEFNICVSIEKKKKDDSMTIIEFRSKELANMLNPLLTPIGGGLDKKLLDSESKIYSYLLGAYYRAGGNFYQNLYTISGHNINSAYFLLKEARCNNIVSLSPKYNVPIMEILYFEPSVYLKKYLDSFEKEKEELYKFNGRKPKKNKTREIIKHLFDDWNNFTPPPLPNKSSK